jgi:hypothetical protein
MVSNIPGLRARKRVVATIKSVFVNTIPRAFAMSEYIKKKTRAWKKTAELLVRPFINLRLRPLVVRTTPGLRARKRAAGMATF